MQRILPAILLLVTMSGAIAQPADLETYAADFLASLDDKLRARAVFAYDDDERFNWNFVPKARRGVSLHDLSDQQEQLAFRLLKASLSEQGYRKTTGIVELEAILRRVEGRDENDDYRDPQKYYLTIFGKPAKGNLWGWRFEGHHLSVNFSAADGKILASTPTFMGANPAIVPAGEQKGKQTLRLETELGFKLINSLDPAQLKEARFSDTALPEIVSGNSRGAKQLEPKGISYGALTAAQQQLFNTLLEVYVRNYELGFASTLMEKIRKAGFGNLSFAWAGSLAPGAGHYYRIQGPMLLIEYDNTQTNANHVHSAVRDLTNDFAEDILREHYRKHHE